MDVAGGMWLNHSGCARFRCGSRALHFRLHALIYTLLRSVSFASAGQGTTMLQEQGGIHRCGGLRHHEYGDLDRG
jgi:hypothetical protein